MFLSSVALFSLENSYVFIKILKEDDIGATSDCIKMRQCSVAQSCNTKSLQYRYWVKILQNFEDPILVLLVELEKSILFFNSDFETTMICPRF